MNMFSHLCNNRILTGNICTFFHEGSLLNTHSNHIKYPLNFVIARCRGSSEERGALSQIAHLHLSRFRFHMCNVKYNYHFTELYSYSSNIQVYINSV